MKKILRSGVMGLALGLVSIGFATTSQATIVVVSEYNLGEGDSGAVAGGAGNATTTDSSGNGFNLTSKIGSPTYSGDHAPGIGSLSMSFDGNGSYYAGPTVTNATENFGISLYVKASDLTSGQGIAINGSGCCSGFGIVMDSGEFFGLYGGVDVVAIGAAAADTWAYIALVNDGGVTRTFFNLVENSPITIGDPHPATGPVCCNPPLNMTIGSDGTHHFSGLIDDVRVFTFAAGEFSPDDLLPPPPVNVPEPASLALFGLGLAALGFVRRKKQ